MANLISLTGR